MSHEFSRRGHLYRVPTRTRPCRPQLRSEPRRLWVVLRAAAADRHGAGSLNLRRREMVLPCDPCSISHRHTRCQVVVPLRSLRSLDSLCSHCSLSALCPRCSRCSRGFLCSLCSALGSLLRVSPVLSHRIKPRADQPPYMCSSVSTAAADYTAMFTVVFCHTVVGRELGRQGVAGRAGHVGGQLPA